MGRLHLLGIQQTHRQSRLRLLIALDKEKEGEKSPFGFWPHPLLLPPTPTPPSMQLSPTSCPREKEDADLGPVS